MAPFRTFMEDDPLYFFTRNRISDSAQWIFGFSSASCARIVARKTRADKTQDGTLLERNGGEDASPR